MDPVALARKLPEDKQVGLVQFTLKAADFFNDFVLNLGSSTPTLHQATVPCNEGARSYCGVHLWPPAKMRFTQRACAHARSSCSDAMQICTMRATSTRRRWSRPSDASCARTVT